MSYPKAYSPRDTPSFLSHNLALLLLSGSSAYAPVQLPGPGARGRSAASCGRAGCFCPAACFVPSKVHRAPLPPVPQVTGTPPPRPASCWTWSAGASWRQTGSSLLSCKRQAGCLCCEPARLQAERAAGAYSQRHKKGRSRSYLPSGPALRRRCCGCGTRPNAAPSGPGKSHGTGTCAASFAHVSAPLPCAAPTPTLHALQGTELPSRHTHPLQPVCCSASPAGTDAVLVRQGTALPARSLQPALHSTAKLLSACMNLT